MYTGGSAGYRTGLLGCGDYDIDGLRFHWLDAKGLGLLEYRDLGNGRKRPIATDPKLKGVETMGLLPLEDAMWDREMTETLSGLGVRTHRVPLIAQLKSILTEGGELDIDQAREKGLIKHDVVPVVALRLFRSPFRIIDIARGHKMRFEGMRAYAGDDELLSETVTMGGGEISRDDLFRTHLINV